MSAVYMQEATETTTGSCRAHFLSEEAASAERLSVRTDKRLVLIPNVRVRPEKSRNKTTKSFSIHLFESHQT